MFCEFFCVPLCHAGWIVVLNSWMTRVCRCDVLVGLFFPVVNCRFFLTHTVWYSKYTHSQIASRKMAMAHHDTKNTLSFSFIATLFLTDYLGLNSRVFLCARSLYDTNVPCPLRILTFDPRKGTALIHEFSCQRGVMKVPASEKGGYLS